MSNFQPARAKLTIGSLDNAKLAVEAQYNPKELNVEKPVNWSEKADAHLEFIGVQCRTFNVELMFDGYEERTSVMKQIDLLEQLSSPRDHASRREKMRRPHRCIVLWGEQGMPRLRCVVNKLSTKYVMWDENGKPLRAICSVELKEMHIDRKEIADQLKQQIHASAQRSSERADQQREREAS